MADDSCWWNGWISQLAHRITRRCVEVTIASRYKERSGGTMFSDRCFTAPLARYPRGAREIFYELRTTEGYTALYRGATAILLRAFPANAVTETAIYLFRDLYYSSLLSGFFSRLWSSPQNARCFVWLNLLFSLVDILLIPIGGIDAWHR